MILISHSNTKIFLIVATFKYAKYNNIYIDLFVIFLISNNNF